MTDFTKKTLKVLEFYSGIGGFHVATKLTKNPYICYNVVASFEINDFANKVYSANFDGVKIFQNNIESLKASTLEKLDGDLYLLSPPCQPYTRNGLHKGIKDQRSKSFLHIINLIEKLTKKPTYILIENVVGFESSETFNLLLKLIDNLDYHIRLFMLSPLQVGIPNQRMRCYILAKPKFQKFYLMNYQKDQYLKGYDLNISILYKIINMITKDELDRWWPTSPSDYYNENDIKERVFFNRFKENVGTKRNLNNFSVLDINDDIGIYKLECFLTPMNADYDLRKKLEDIIPIDHKDLLLSKELVLSKGRLADIVTKDSCYTTCFTKSYSRYIEGTGSILQRNCNLDCKAVFENHSRESFDKNSEGYKEACDKVMKLELSYLSPRDILRLCCFPRDYTLDIPEMTVGKAFKLLGNSLNAFVVAGLINYLTSD